MVTTQPAATAAQGSSFLRIPDVIWEALRLGLLAQERLSWYEDMR